MSDTPKFEVIDRRKMKAEEEQEQNGAEQAATRDGARAEPRAGPRLVGERRRAATARSS